MIRTDNSAHVYLRKRIQADVFSHTHDPRLSDSQHSWIFDFRKLLLQPEALRHVADAFLATFPDAADAQVGTLEVTGVPLATGIIMRASENGGPEIPCFFIRKSRKKQAYAELLRMVEGNVTAGREVILVDDVINSGRSFIKQVEVLEGLGYTVRAVWVILRYRDLAFYEYFHEKGIAVKSLFCLDDFTDALGVANVQTIERAAPRISYTVHWKFQSEDPAHFYIAPKSTPALDAKKLYVGSDVGIFWALNQADGSIAWSRKVGLHPPGKGIFSSPAISGKTVYFGAYDGNVYALDTEAGTPRWIFFDADWIGSSPAIAEDLGLLFIGLEFGLIRKRGGIAAIDLKTGEKKWEDRAPMFTHASPRYIKETQQVAIGSNDGTVYLYNAKNGELVWRFDTIKENSAEALDSGFGTHDIKAAVAYDHERDYLVFGTFNGEIYIIARENAEVVAKHKSDFGYLSTPLIYNGHVYASSIDKHLYCIDIETGEEKWRWNAGARIFASPVLLEDSIYIGSNNGFLVALNPETGQERSFFPATERITNAVAYNPETKRIFLPTFANEIYCIEKKEDDPSQE